MMRYLIRRLLFFIPVLLAISLLAFAISIHAPGDPVERLISTPGDDGSPGHALNTMKQKAWWRKKLGLDLPLFYITIRSASYPEPAAPYDSEVQQQGIEELAFSNGYGINAAAFHDHRSALNMRIRSLRAELSPATYMQLQNEMNGLLVTAGYENAQQTIDRIQQVLNGDTKAFQLLSGSLQPLLQSVQHGISNSALLNNYLPLIRFHGDNMYHRWIFGDGNWLTGEGAVYSRGVIRGDFGISYQTRQPVSEVILQKAGWSLLLAVASVLLAYLISIPAGVWAAAKKGSRFDKISALLFFILYSMPSFWLATLLLMVFANPDYLLWFPASGVKPVTGYPVDASLFEKIRLSAPYLVLPLICYTYSSFAFLSRAMRANVIGQLNMDYIRTAKAKGAGTVRIAFIHALRNSMLPLITVFANIFPAALGGSVILETIFTIPGMGFETYQSIQNQNYPMIVAIFTITGFLTVAGFLISDILYAFADPRIQFQKHQADS